MTHLVSLLSYEVFTDAVNTELSGTPFTVIVLGCTSRTVVFRRAVATVGYRGAQVRGTVGKVSSHDSNDLFPLEVSEETHNLPTGIEEDNNFGLNKHVVFSILV